MTLTPTPERSEAIDSLGEDDLSGRPLAEVLARIAAEIRGRDRFLVTAHEQPDGDAIGSQAALGLALRALGKRASVVVTRGLPARYAEFVPAGLVEVVDEDWARSRERERAFDVAIVLDTSEPKRLGFLRDLVLADGVRRLCIDHHVDPPRGIFDEHLVIQRAPATASLVLALLDVLGVELEPQVATLLWVGLATDTGWFRFSNTTPLALREGARLLECGGFRIEDVFESVYGRHRFARVQLLGDVLRGLTMTLDGRFVYGRVLLEDLERHQVTLEELEGTIDSYRGVAGAEVVALITQVGGEEFKISLRSLGAADVERVARAFGGGGHRKAAGCRFAGSLESLERELVRSVEKELA